MMRAPYNPGWKMRRRTVFASLVFCAWAVAYSMHKTYGVDGCQDSRVAETVISSAFLLAGGVIGSYVFGAVWDDSNKLKAETTKDIAKGEQ